MAGPAERDTRGSEAAAGGASTGETRAFGAPAAEIGAAVAAELVGTFMLVFLGTGTVVALLKPHPMTPLDAVPVALAFGFAVLICVYAFGHVSGAHVNPAVTLSLTAVGKFPLRAVGPYVLAQLAGAVLGSLAVLAVFGEATRKAPILLGATAPGKGVSGGTVFLVEVIITMILLIVISATATDERAEAPAVGLGVGFTVAAGILATLSVSGGSFNPARSLGPMLVSGEFPAWGAYVAGPVAGGVAGALLYRFVIARGSPPTAEGRVEEQG